MGRLAAATAPIVHRRRVVAELEVGAGALPLGIALLSQGVRHHALVLVANGSQVARGWQPLFSSVQLVRFLVEGQLAPPPPHDLPPLTLRIDRRTAPYDRSPCASGIHRTPTASIGSHLSVTFSPTARVCPLHSGFPPAVDASGVAGLGQHRGGQPRAHLGRRLRPHEHVRLPHREAKLLHLGAFRPYDRV